MKAKIIDLKDMTDSREFLEASPPKFLMIFIYILLVP